MTVPMRVFWLPGSSTDPSLPKLQPLGWSDSFDRADTPSTLGVTDNGVTWLTSGTWGVIGGAAYCSAGSGNLWAVADASTADGTLTAVFGAVEDYSGVTFRFVDDGNRLFVNWQGGALRLYKRVAGVSTLIVSVAGGAPVAGNTISVVLAGTSVIVKKNGTTVISQTVTELATATKHGLLAAARGGATRFTTAAFTLAA